MEYRTYTPQEDTFHPAKILDALSERYKLKNDAAIARFLEITPVMVCKLRHRYNVLGGAVILRIHEVTGIAIHEILRLAGDRRRRFRSTPAWSDSRAVVASIRARRSIKATDEHPAT